MLTGRRVSPIVAIQFRAHWASLRWTVYACILGMLLCQCFTPALLYLRDVAWTQPWRLWTAHWVHLGWWHLLLNLLALGLIPDIFAESSRRFFLLLFFVLPFLISVSLWLWQPHLMYYAGLSGVLHGLYVALGLAAQAGSHRLERRMGQLICIGALIKVGWEYTTGISESQQLLGIPVVLVAHQFGLIWGGLMGAGYWIYHRKDDLSKK